VTPTFILTETDVRKQCLAGAASVVDFLGDDGAFPVDTPTLAGLLPASEAAIVGFGADQQDEVGPIELTRIQRGQPCAGVAVQVLVQGGLDPVRPQPFRQTEDALTVRGPVVAVADENARFGPRSVSFFLTAP
jgi:hypothetical protein